MVKVFTSKSGRRILSEKKSKSEIKKLFKRAKEEIQGEGTKIAKFYALHIEFPAKVRK